MSAPSASTAAFDAALAELTALRRTQAEELEAAVAKTRHAAMSAIAAIVRARCPQARYVRFDDGAGMGGMLDRGWGYAKVAGVLDAERNYLPGLRRDDDELTPMERQLDRNSLERRFGAVCWPGAVNSPVVDLAQFDQQTWS